ncbi:MAG: GGDEF domain-containing protein [Planctomycetes bacterium]|nr:GGDEF domain-containing protein [Planctomycetota bacterium]
MGTTPWAFGTEGLLSKAAWRLLDELSEYTHRHSPRDTDLDALALRVLHALGDFVAARARSIYLADLRGALRLSGSSQPASDAVLPVRVSLPATLSPGPTHDGENGAPLTTPNNPSCLPHSTEGDDPLDDRPEIQLLDPSRSLMVQATRRREPLLLTDVNEFREQEGLLAPDHQRSLGAACIVLPLVRAGEIHGVINLADLEREIPRGGTSDHQALRIATRFLAETFSNLHTVIELGSRATRDSLTSLYNYATFYELLAREVLRAGRYGTPLALLLMDLDGFKAINDHFGHLAGDRILSDLARRIRAAKRGTDVAARYAGDEFAVILPETRLDGAQTVAARIREMVGDKPFGFLKTEIQATVSIGIACYRAGMTAVDLVSKADENLYEAKRAGKNTICG